jgi:hypothetical protein
MDKTRTDRSSLALSSYASAAGFALGELLLLTGKSDELPEYLREIMEEMGNGADDLS